MEIELRRARDLTDRDVVRLPAGLSYKFRTGATVNYGHVTGQWREVLNVWRDIPAGGDQP